LPLGASDNRGRACHSDTGIRVIGDSTVITGNRVGTDADGSAALANGDDDVFIDGGDNQIGTTSTGNTIAYNGDTGVTVADSSFNLRNSIRGNNIYLNGSLGIDLGGDGVTMNDPRDSDEGPNELQNFPVLTAVTLSGDTATRSTAPPTRPSSPASSPARSGTPRPTAKARSSSARRR
jgi:hypothetical protein